MELLKGQGAQERVKEVLRISSDGSMVKKSLCLFAYCCSILRHHSERNSVN